MIATGTMSIGIVVEVRDGGSYGFVEDQENGRSHFIHFRQRGGVVFAGERGCPVVDGGQPCSFTILEEGQVVRFITGVMDDGRPGVILWAYSREYTAVAKQMFDHKQRMAHYDAIEASASYAGFEPGDGGISIFEFPENNLPDATVYAD